MACFGLCWMPFGFALRFGVGGVPAGVDGVVFGIAGADGRGEAEELGNIELTGLGLALDFGVFLEGLGADVGGEELGVAGFEAEVGGGGVAEELVGAGDDVGVDGGHAVVVAEVLCGCDGHGTEVLEPVKAPLEGADDAVGVASGERGLPGIHPLRVKLGEHYL